MESNGEVDGRVVGGLLDAEMKRDSVICSGERDLGFSPSPRPGK